MPAQTVTQLLVFPTAVLQAGQTYGPSATPQMGAPFSAYQFALTSMSWPASGDVLTMTVNRSTDGGNTWLYDASITLAGGPWLTRQGATTTTGTWAVTVGSAAGEVLTTALTDLYNVTVQCLQDCSVLIRMSGVQ